MANLGIKACRDISFEDRSSNSDRDQSIFNKISMALQNYATESLKVDCPQGSKWQHKP